MEEGFATYVPLLPAFPEPQPGAVNDCVPAPQKPTIFWIGCSDARVSEAHVLPNKEIFVHRNIANQFNLSDPNALAVLAHAVSLSTVEEIVIVGHTNCGGVRACYEAANPSTPTPPLHWSLWFWLTHLLHLAKQYIGKPERELIDENVRVQVRNVRRVVPTLTGKFFKIRGYVYDIACNELQEIIMDD